MLIGYCRVSTTEQNLDAQKAELTRFGCERIFEDFGITGAKMNRPGLITAREFCRAGDTLVTWKLDRLGRTVAGVVEFINELDTAKIGFKSISEGVGNSTPTERLLLNLLSVVAEWELQTIRERSLNGLRLAREQGRIGGRPKKLSDSQVAMLIKLKSDKSITGKAIAQQLGIGESTMYRYLKDIDK